MKFIYIISLILFIDKNCRNKVDLCNNSLKEYSFKVNKKLMNFQIIVIFKIYKKLRNLKRFNKNYNI